MVAIFKGYQDYAEFVKEMEDDGWMREQITVDNTNTTLATMTAGAAGTGTAGASTVIEVTCPPGRVMSVMGTQQVPAGADRGTAHSFWMRLASTMDVEIHELTHINLQKVTPSTAVVPLIKDIYQNLAIVNQRAGAAIPWIAGQVCTGNLYKGDNDIHRFRKGIVVYGQEKLQIQTVDTTARPKNTVGKDYTQFALDCDLWTKTV